MGITPVHVIAEAMYRQEQLQRDVEVLRVTRALRGAPTLRGHRLPPRRRRLLALLIRRPERA